MESGRESGGIGKRHDEGFTGAVMPAGLRNFGVSELAEESYLNEAGICNPPLPFHWILSRGHVP